jgi:hypothetical protein
MMLSTSSRMLSLVGSSLCTRPGCRPRWRRPASGSPSPWSAVCARDGGSPPDRVIAVGGLGLVEEEAHQAGAVVGQDPWATSGGIGRHGANRRPSAAWLRMIPPTRSGAAGRGVGHTEVVLHEVLRVHGLPEVVVVGHGACQAGWRHRPRAVARLPTRIEWLKVPGAVSRCGAAPGDCGR